MSEHARLTPLCSKQLSCYEQGLVNAWAAKLAVADRGKQFLNMFYCAIHNLKGTKHQCTCVYDTHWDGHSEHTDRILGEMLRHSANLKYDNWDLHLPLAESAHRNASTTAT